MSLWSLHLDHRLLGLRLLGLRLRCGAAVMTLAAPLLAASPAPVVLLVSQAPLAEGGPLAGRGALDLGRLEAGGPDLDEEWKRLLALPDPGGELVRAALERLEQGSLDSGARRRLVALIVQKAAPGGDQLPGICSLLDDPDGGVRKRLLDFLVRPDHGDAHLAARVEALELLASRDPMSRLRQRSLEALGELDDELAVEALVRLCRSLPPPDRGAAAAALRPTPRSREAVRMLVRAGFEEPPGQRRTPDDVLARVLPTHGRLMADEAAGGESPADRAPLVLGLRHPDGEVRLAAARAFQRLLGRLEDIGEVERAERLLGELARDGLDPRLVHYQKARQALSAAADSERALEAALALGRTPALGGPGLLSAQQRSSGVEHALWSFRSWYLAGLAHFTAGRHEEALSSVARGSSALEVALGQRLDLASDDESRLEHVDLLHQVAVARLTTILIELARSEVPDRELAGLARDAHRLSIEAQRGHARVVGDTLATWDNLLDHELSPLRICFGAREFPGLSVERGIELRFRLGRVLASVAPLEVPGFEPWPGLAPDLADPLQDPRRSSVLRDVLEAGLAQAEDEIDSLRQRILQQQLEQPGMMITPRDELAFQRAVRARSRLAEDLARLEAEPELLHELRIPSSLALQVGSDLRAEGRAAESRTLTERMREHVEEAGLYLRFFWGLQLQARIEMAIGSSWTDEDQPRRAEQELLKAVERLEGIEERYAELGASRRQIAAIEAMRSQALVSLAVNANVKLGDPRLALEYYERAYELRQDDFMRVLLACYRARMERDEEARALLREIRPHPDLYYNLACTHALLGDTERALDYLEMELTENLASTSARRRQREWAKEDPDLASLRDDPRFEQLVEVD